MDNKDVAKEWFEFAKRDLESALFLLNMYPLPLEIICYHCQQSAEKYLKGYIILKGGKPVKTHDLIKVLNIDAGRRLYQEPLICISYLNQV